MTISPPSARTVRPVIRGTRYAISSRKPQATQVGARILEAGGNAFDACVAAAAVLAVTDPAMTGLGGDAFALVFSAEEGKVYSINAGGTAPKLATIAWFREHCHGTIPVNDGLLSASMPTLLDTWFVLLERWGTRGLAELLKPAMELAEDGFPVSEYLADYFSFAESKLQKYPSTAQIYFPAGHRLRAGDKLRNPDLARVLSAIAKTAHEENLRAARDLFYKGEIARTMAAFCERNGGLYRYDDFAEYSVKLEDPVSIDYRGCRVFKNPSATQGPTELMFLNLLEGLPLAAMHHNSEAYIHHSVEAAKLAYADREHLGDTDFIDVPFDRLLSKQYARERRSLIDPDKASLELRTGAANLAGAAAHDGDTSYLAIVDRHGNAVSYTPSLHSAFGTGVVIEGLGFILNCRGDLYHLDPEHPNALVPRKRARSTLTPTLVMKYNRPFLVLGSPGGDDQPLRIAQTFLNVVEFGMNIQEAIEAPRWSTSSFPASEFPHTMYPGHLALEDRIPEEVRAVLAARGHLLEIKGAWTLGANCAICVDPSSGVLSAGADPRGDSDALAW